MTVAILPPLLAAADWIQVAIFLVFFFFWLMKKLYDLNKEAAAKQVRPQAGQPPVQPRPQAPAPQPIAAGGQQADPLRSQVEEFLRRAGRPPGGQGASQAGQRPSDTETTDERRARTPERRPVLSPQKQRPAPRKKQRQSVAEHVAERVAARSQSVADQTSRLGQRIKAEDQQFDNQLKAKFDHVVGTLADSVNPVAQEAPPPPADTPARRIAEMLANPEGVRQAMILNEILSRPSDRW